MHSPAQLYFLQGVVAPDPRRRASAQMSARCSKRGNHLRVGWWSSVALVAGTSAGDRKASAENRGRQGLVLRCAEFVLCPAANALERHTDDRRK